MKKHYRAMVLLLSIFLGGCAYYRPLMGDYPEHIEWRESEKSYEVVFDDAVDMLTEYGYLPEMIDRTNGVIRVKGFVSLLSATFESKGKPFNESKLVVMATNGPIVDKIPATLVVLIRANNAASTVGVKMILTGGDKYAQMASLGNLEREVVQKMVK